MIWGLIIIYICAIFGLGMCCAKHGEEKNEKYNFWLSLIAYLLQLILIWWALGWRFY